MSRFPKLKNSLTTSQRALIAAQRVGPGVSVPQAAAECGCSHQSVRTALLSLDDPLLVRSIQRGDLTVYAASGHALSRPRVTVLLSHEQQAALKAAAVREGTAVPTILRKLIDEHLRSEPKASSGAADDRVE